MIAVIGDIHGCYFTLAELYARIIKEYPGIMVYAVGDLVDRGNHSAEVINFLIDEDIEFTSGNHDYMFYYYFKEPSGVFARSWSMNGSETTLQSYERRPDDLENHLDLIKNSPLFIDTPDCFISHAGVSSFYADELPSAYADDPEAFRKLIVREHNSERGVLWNRDPILDLGKIQVVGHTKLDEVTYDETANALYIDTGACVGNKLSAVVLDNNCIIDTLSENTHLNDII